MAQQMTLAVASADIIQRISQRLGAPAVWQDKGDTVLVHVDTVKARLTGGWLLCSLDLESDQTGRQNLQFLYFLGTDASSGTTAGAVVNAPAAAAAPLVERWGATVQRVIWDAVLDVIEAAVYKAGTEQAGQKLTLGGFFATDSGLEAGVFAGDL